MIAVVDGIGWQVEYERDRWLDVEWFVVVPTQGGVVFFAMVHVDNRLSSSSGKLRKTTEREAVAFVAGAI